MSDSDDDMPPLEYVGHSLEYAADGLQPGQKVLLCGLTTASLNGQKGTVLPFTDADVCRKGRLGIRLDNGKEMAIKRENLKKVTEEDSDDDMPPLTNEGMCAGSKPVEDSDSDDCMPPLDYVASTATATTKQVARDEKSRGATVFKVGESVHLKDLSDSKFNKQHAVVIRRSASEEDIHVKVKLSGEKLTVKAHQLEKVDDDTESTASMPDLEHVELPAASEAGDDDSDGSMPPLDYVGKAACEKTKPAKAEVQPDGAESDDSMPPLDYAASASSSAKAVSQSDLPAKKALSTVLKVGHLVTIKGLASRKELNGKEGVILALANDNGRFSVKCNSTGEKIMIKDANIDLVDATDGDSDDSMPPLDYVGRGAAASSKPPASGTTCQKADPANTAEDSDDSMPPLHNDGNQQAPESEDDMPPLEYVGKAPAACSSSTPGAADSKTKPAPSSKKEADDDSDDSMPPLDYFHGKAKDDEEDLPPLEDEPAAPVVSSQATSSSLPKQPVHRFDVGDTVKLAKLKKAELNGQQGVILASEDSERVAVKLNSSGQKLLIKPENLEHVEAPADDSDDSMPPMEHKSGGGDRSVPAASSAPKESTVRETFSADSLPPLEDADTNRTTAPTAGSSATTSADAHGFCCGNIVVLKDVGNVALTGQRATVVNSPSRTHADRCTVQVIGTGEKMIVAYDQIEKLYSDGPSSVQLGKPGSVTVVESKEVAVQKQTKDGGRVTQRKQGERKTRHKKDIDDNVPDSDDTSPLVETVPKPTAPLNDTSSRQFFKATSKASEMSDFDTQSVTSDVWFRLDAEKPLKEWCASLNLPEDFVKRLEEEEVSSPTELAFVPEDELHALATGLKLGPKGRFLAAVKYLRKKL